MDRRVCLKIKLKSLAAEASMIKFEEQKRKVPRKRRIENIKLAITIEHREACEKERARVRVASTKRRSQAWYPMSLQQLLELQRHRIDVVRKESRLTGIAYAFIRGREFAKVDSGRNLSGDDWKRIGAMIERYGEKGSIARLGDWIDPAAKAA